MTLIIHYAFIITPATNVGSVFSQVLNIAIIIIKVNCKQHGVLKAFPKITFHFFPLINVCIQAPPLSHKTLQYLFTAVLYTYHCYGVGCKQMHSVHSWELMETSKNIILLKCNFVKRIWQRVAVVHI